MGCAAATLAVAGRGVGSCAGAIRRINGCDNAMRRGASSIRAPRTLPILAVAAGGVIGSTGRVLAAEIGPHPASGWPVTTLAVNLIGAFLLGAYLARRQRAVNRPWSLQLWAIGALGSFTTFSGLSLEVVQLLEAGRSGIAAGYVSASMIGGLAAAIAGDAAGSRRL